MPHFAAAIATPPGTRTSPRARSAVILYVEDHPVNVLVMEALLLHRPNLRLVVATTGEEGLQAARIEQPDLLLLDYHLPDCNGADLLAQLRQIDGLADTPAIVVSATDAARSVGPDGFIEFWPKPLDVRSTLVAIDRLIDAQQASREHAAEPSALERSFQ